MKNIKYLIVSAVCLLTISACGDKFLDEDLTTMQVNTYLDTPEGIKELALGLPQTLRLPACYEFSYAMNNMGTDEFACGSDAAAEPWNNYDARLQSTVTSSSNTVQPVTTWDVLYAALSNQNTVIQKAPNLLAGDPDLNNILGSAYFMRAWSYFYLVQQWGDVPLQLTPIEGFTREFSRTPRKEVIQSVIDDFQKAYDLLQNVAAPVEGKIYKDAAAHFLAKVLLYRQSEINSDFNADTKNEDLARALTLCDEVIAHRPLAPNFADLQNFTGAGSANQKLPEVLLTAQFSSASTGRFSNQMPWYFISIYQNWAGMIRDLSGSREYARLRTTEYTINSYDRVNDSRFWKSFRTMQRLNSPGRNTNVGTQQVLGQVGVMFIVNSPNDADRFEAQTGDGINLSSIGYPGSVVGRQPPLIKIKDAAGVFDTLRSPVYAAFDYPGEGVNVVPNVIVSYRKVRNLPNADTYGYATLENAGLPTPQNNSTWPSLNKFLDATRTGITTDNGSRSFTVARVAETYLIAAEVKVRQGDNAAALTYINKVRERAAYKAGEDRDSYVDGGQSFTTLDGSTSTTFWGHNTYYISNNIPFGTIGATDIKINSVAALPAEDAAIISKLGYSSDFDKMICLILNERTRELCGEMHRWTDLARTKTLVKRTLTYNDDAAYSNTLKEHHLLRPLPQEFLDQIWKNGHALTADEKQAMQNPGY